jgi:hypothetical protein
MRQTKGGGFGRNGMKLQGILTKGPKNFVVRKRGGPKRQNGQFAHTKRDGYSALPRLSALWVR